MRKIIFLFIAMIYSMHVDAMMNKLKIRRCRSYCYERPKIQKKELICFSSQETFHPSFPKEVDENILRFIGTNTAGETLKESAQIFSALICVNKFTYMHMDDDKRILGWIKDLSKRFNCLDIDVAKMLPTRAGKNRCAVQLGLWIGWKLGDISMKNHLNNLKKCGLVVNFSYDRDYPSPLLQCCSDLANKDGAAHWLIENGADINICTPSGNNACILALLKGHTFLILNKFVEHKDFRPNHQNNDGETVLHYYLRQMKYVDLNSPGLISTTTKILARGANPTLANKDGETPLMVAHMIKKEEFKKPIVELLEQAVLDFNFREK